MVTSYSTNEVAALCFVPRDTIWWWERKGLIPQAKSKGKRYRRYWSEEQAEVIRQFSDNRYGTVR
ncbi:hypothetical protein LCGC14_1028720 [marine sediment metagenome]|uniref:HTH merR-type domain-containing protein n=1 Tax=marine sediment metagenome TaxID=412755 RepID=A0A0F9MZR5_9ZZZZ